MRWPYAGPLEELRRLDVAVYETIAEASTPTLDRTLNRVSRAADYSKLSLASAAVLAVAGGRPGRRAAVRGMTAVAVTASIVNAVIKPVLRRRRPDRAAPLASPERQVKMPASHSFPSGHAAAAFAFATGAGQALPWTTPPLGALATMVGYSRVHTGVHYPMDVIAGSLCGIIVATATNRVLDSASTG